MADATPIELRLQVEAASADREELDRLTGQLLDELRDQRVESADLAADGPAPGGTKSAAALATTIATSVLPAVLPVLLEFLRDWLGRQRDAEVSFTGTINGQAVAFRGGARELDALVRSLARASDPRGPSAS